ncbi:response regulator transcription factor [Chryseolinea lacunae]|uniref:Response regulator transcription factor n=1 Tax=Chryseolinea lacunae TaxID=2801331 RepID=A0ABS1KTS7_9BACT|nr:response regulator transcription factor [Chryseolinea lacunae]MBL0742718.1 response regulator transcription factor [Chryseolinea lacunae]
MTTDKIKVLIADDHKIIRVGLQGILQRATDVDVVGEAEDGNDVMAFLEKNVTDVILMDIDMGKASGTETTQKVKQRYPDVHVLALTMHEEQEHIIQMLEAGASGYLLKNTGSDELVAAIHAVAKGDSYYSSSVSASLLKALTNLKSKTPARPNKDIPLSEREIQVLQLIAQECSNGEIAEKLFISIRTVDTHRRNILEKLQVKNTAGLVKYAIEKALI